MQKNSGTLDRAVRIAVGLGLIGAAATGAIGAWGYIGVAPLLIGIFGICPLYSVLGINTCPMAKR